MRLIENPFYILGATPRDNRKRIMDLAEEKSLTSDYAVCNQACSELTNPRKRLTAEIAWIPGIKPKRIVELISILEKEPAKFRNLKNVLALTMANLMAEALSRLDGRLRGKDLAQWIEKMALAFEDINCEDTRILINEERTASGFPEVRELYPVEAEIETRRRYYQQTIKHALDQLPSTALVKTLTAVVESTTRNGEQQAPILINDIVDLYEIEVQHTLDQESEKIEELVDQAIQTADSGKPPAVIAKHVKRIEKVVRNWDFLAQPIQVSCKSRGLDHDLSQEVGDCVRGLAIHLYNERGLLEISQGLTSTLQEVFAEIPEIAEQTQEDADALGEIAEQRKLSRLLDPISDLCKAALENSEKQPNSADREAQKVMNAAHWLIANLSASKPGAEILSKVKDEIALTLMHCAVVYGNKTEEWKPCIAFLKMAFMYASSQEVKSRIQKNLTTVRENDRLYGDLKPISSAPSLYTINGIGTTMYGLTDHDPASGSYLSTYYFVFFAIPIFPISRYRVIPTGNGYRFLGKAPLRTFDKWHQAISISLGLIAWMIISMQ